MSETLSDLAIETIRSILIDPKASPAVRLKAALAILNSETLAATEAPAAAEPAAEPDPAATIHPPAITIRRDAPKTGRNDVCPCGSGLKFKRCCLNKPATLRAAA